MPTALPEISAAFESSRDTVLHNSGQLIGSLERRLDAQLNNLDARLSNVPYTLCALVQGRVIIPLIGYLGGLDAVGAVGGLGIVGGPGAVARLGTAGGPVALGTPTSTVLPEQSPPVLRALTKAYTVQDVWRDWKDGVGGRLAVRDLLEERWGSRWRPGGTIRTQFYRRKVIWDELLTRISRGQSEDEAVAELERLRGGAASTS
jgi:hypothetical protein